MAEIIKGPHEHVFRYSGMSSHPHNSCQHCGLEREVWAEQQITTLKAQLAKAEKGHKLYKSMYEAKAKFLTVTIKRLEDSSWEHEQELEKQLTELEQDGKRLDWLEETLEAGNIVELHWEDGDVSGFAVLINGKYAHDLWLLTVRKAIDAAMVKERGGDGQAQG